MEYDLVLIHPPAIYDFRKKPIFLGALGTTAQAQLIKVPLGMLSIAEYLDRHGYKVIIDNLADRMVSNKGFDAEEHIRNNSARIYAIGLHFHHHSQGAIEIARLCKSLHPDSLVVLGGLTATCFHEEIIRKYEFVDAVIRGEAEKPFLQLIRALEKHRKLTETPNLTYRTDAGEICVTPLMKPSDNLDEFEFTRFDLLEPKTSIFGSETEPQGSLVVCRGCIYNCTICGGSAYSYRTYLGRDKPAFRRPMKIVEDIKKLNEQDIRVVHLYQDPRMGGEHYWKELTDILRREKPDIDRLTMDIFAPVDEEFAREVATTGQRVVFYICPDSGCLDVRKLQGRCYSNSDLLKTIKLCYRYHIPVTAFFSIGLAGETPEGIKETLDLYDEFFQLEHSEAIRGRFGDTDNSVPIGGPIISYVFLDPGSLAFDFPEKYGYKPILNNLEKYIKARTKPSWHQWLNYETNIFNRDTLIELILKSIEYSTHRRELYGVYDRSEANTKRTILAADRIAVAEVDSIMNLPDRAERECRLKSLKDAADSIFNPIPNKHDPFGYYEMMKMLAVSG